MPTTTLSQRLYERAAALIPGGVNSPVRAWRAVGGQPLFIQRAHGCNVWDADGRMYVDYVGSWGPMILGHAHPQVLTAIQTALRDGTSFGAPTEREVELAEALAKALPSIEMVRLVSSGTEAAMTAIRLARGYTGRAKILKFSGCYHGHADALLVRAGSGAATFGVPDSAGVPEAVASQTLVAEFNDVHSVHACLDAEGEHIAAVIIEPVVGNMGVIPPEPGFLEALREATSRVGALLIFDEVITGFRLAYGGVQTRLGIDPDLTVLGKIVGGGLPLAAFGGKRKIMEQLAPLGPVYQAGTLSGNPLAVAAGLQTLALLAKPGTYERLEVLGAQLEAGLRTALATMQTPACVNRVGSMWTVFFGASVVRDAPTARACYTELYARWFRGMLERGIYLPPSQFEAAFISLAHSEADIEATVRAAGEVMATLR
jgi:glutamate-1-semialdehyde 2,1-aminomutase